MRFFNLMVLAIATTLLSACGSQLTKKDLFVMPLMYNEPQTFSAHLATAPEWAADAADFMLVRGLFEDNTALIEQAFSAGARFNKPLYNPFLLGYLNISQELTEFPGNPKGVHMALYDVHCKTNPYCAYNYNHLFSTMDMAQSPEALALLRKHGAGAQTQDNKDHAFAIATFTGNTKGMDYLHKQGANITRVYPTGQTPIHLATTAGRVNSLEWLLKKGVSPDTTRHIKVVSQYSQRPINMDSATPLHITAHYHPWGVHTEATFATRNTVMKTLLKYKANPNLRSSFSDIDAYATRHDMQQATPLHIALFSAGNSQSNEVRKGQEVLAETLRKGGANPALTNDKGQTAEAVYRQIADLRSARTQQLRRQHAQRQQQQQQQNSNVINPGRFMAGAAMIGMGAYGVSQGGEVGMRAIEVSGAGLADILSDGNTNHSEQVRQRAQQQTQQQTGQQTGAAAAPGFQQETYSFTCPSGQRADVPLHYRTQACRTAMIDFARAYSCNEYNRFDQVHSVCQSACDDRNCLQK